MRGSYGLVVAGLAGFGLTGCAQLAGIDKTNDDERQVTLVYDRMSIGTKVATAPLVLDGLTAAYLVPDGSVFDQEPADPVSDGLWSAKIKTGTPPVLFTLPDKATYLWQLPSRTMHGAFTALEHPDPIAPPANAKITVDGTLDTPVVAGETFDFLEVGTWAQFTLPVAVAATTLGNQSFPYASVTNLAAPLALAAITADDAILVMRHAAGVLTGLGEIAPAGPQGATTMVTTPIAAVAQDQMLAMPIDAAGFAARFTGEKPVETAAVAMSWQITAAPGFAHGSTTGPLLRSGTAVAGDASISGKYGNPFAATHMWAAALSFNVLKGRTFAPQGAAGPSLGLGTALVETTAPDTTTPIALSAALPLVITVGITPLATDGTSVLIDASKPVPVSFTTDGMPASLYEMELVELVVNGASYTQTRKLLLAGDTPSWQIPAAFLAPAHLYFFRAIAINGGYADLATGDLSTVMAPYAAGIHDGGVFTVTL